MTRFTALPLPAEPPTQRVVLPSPRAHSQIVTTVPERHVLDPCLRTSNLPSPLDHTFRIAAVGDVCEMTRFTALPLPAELPTQRVVLPAPQVHSQIFTAVLERDILDPCPRTSNHHSPLDHTFGIAAVRGVC